MNAVSLPVAPPTEAVAVPAVARRIVHAGLGVFVFAAVLVWLVKGHADAHFYATLALSAYAGLVLALLAGVHWGIAMRHPGAPAGLFAWPALLLIGTWVTVVMPPYAGLVIAGVLLVASYLVDRKRYPVEGLSHWLTLRFRLSAGGAFCCWFAAAQA